VAHRLPPLVPELGLRLLKGAAVPGGLLRFLTDRRAYRDMPSAEPLHWRDVYPKLADRVGYSPYDSHYFHQDIWAARCIAELTPERHVDVGSRVDLVGFLTSLTNVTYVDIRPLGAEVERLESIAGSVLALPFADRSLESVSCLHVAEHIGLGRYGDPLDPLGTRKAASELQRVLRPGGQLLFSVPVGRPRVCFNAHRIHDPCEVPSMFDELDCAEFSSIDDTGVFERQRAPAELADASYGCGLYRFIRLA
jgi:SAM-dependent methyltransferase